MSGVQNVTPGGVQNVDPGGAQSRTQTDPTNGPEIGTETGTETGTRTASETDIDGSRPPAGGGLEVLTGRLGHTFEQPSLLRQALTHASVAGHGRAADRSNERLEFLGDRVLGLLVARLLYDTFPAENEGALARRHAALVRREALAQVAEEIDLGAFVRLSRGEEEAGGARNPTLLADACEAVIAALYLDGGLEAAEVFVDRYWRRLMGATVRPPKDAKTALQEWAQGRGLALPRYREVGREGPPHAPCFTVEVSVSGGAPAMTADGPSKRMAEQAAAEALLEMLVGRDVP